MLMSLVVVIIEQGKRERKRAVDVEQDSGTGGRSDMPGMGKKCVGARGRCSHLTFRFPLEKGVRLARVAEVSHDTLLVAVRHAARVHLARVRIRRVVADVTSDG